MSNAGKGQAGKQQAKSAVKKPATANVPPPRQVKRTPPITAPTQVATPPAPVEQRPKQLPAKQLPTTALDGFTGFNDSVEGDDERSQGGSMVQGTRIKFSADGKWLTAAGDAMSLERELIVVDIVRTIVKWVDEMPKDTIVIPPGEKFPNIDAKNEAAPKSEWRDKFGQFVGPWEMQYLVYLIDAFSLDKITFPTNSIGGGIAVRELADKVAWMRRYKGPKVSAVITLADTFFNTKYGGRQRPHFQIVRWIGFDTGGDNALPAPKPTLEGGAAAKSEALPWKEVEEPSLREELNDDIPDFDAE
jgi:hypothetical protein